ncbi:hypothetical protein [Cysteiniphilum marinum]|uniref:hypothetical protein n=1 Tax=Cysteiniphilum marinum TaxID=2774191 RepID=UPI00193ADD16|nr:hypothetical protein [Cysteiniphilum marinum]
MLNMHSVKTTITAWFVGLFQKNESLYYGFKRLYLRLAILPKDRIKFYETLGMLLQVSSFGNAINQMIHVYEKHGGIKIMGKRFFDRKKNLLDMLRDVSYRHHKVQGKEPMTSVKALSIYLPDKEIMMLAGQDQVTTETLENTAFIAKKLHKMRIDILKRLFTPLIYLVAVAAMLFIVNYGLKPVIESTGNMDRVSQATKVMISLSDFFVNHATAVVTGFIVVIIAVIFVMTNIVNPFRTKILDFIAPFSIYKKIAGVRFLIALALLLKGEHRLPIKESLLSIRKYSGHYTAYFIGIMLRKLSLGKTSGEFLTKSGFFSNELVELIEIYALSDQLEKGIYALGHEYLDKQIFIIETSIRIMNNVFMVLLGVFMSWYGIVMLSLSDAFVGK